PNGIDHTKYRLLQPIENRPPRIAMLYHIIDWKGSEDGIKALELARDKFPKLQAALFSRLARPKGLPEWIEYHCDPPQEDLVGRIYNGSSMYLCPSWREGWHLPPAEAMACGCAVVSTDIGGVRDYAEHGVTALLSPPRNPEALAQNILRLLEDDELRIRLAKAGHERIQEFTWERSTDLLEQFLKDRV
ncbi:MAG: glycosyltransferase family 4 protein, partial [Desulfobacteraceae bacterium]|nr:glycosyltransferase family 4 protein [Desulfobacteraceae bacterium]